MLGSACITFRYSHALAVSDLGHALCALQAIAWSARAAQQFLSLGPRWPSHVRWLHRSLSAIYTTLALTYVMVLLVVAKVPG